MKKSLVLLVAFIVYITNAQSQCDTTYLKSKIDSLNKELQKAKSNTNSSNCNTCYMDTSLNNGLMIKHNDGHITFTSRKLDGQQQFFIISPILFFLIILLFVFIKLNAEGYKLGDALSENTPVVIDIVNPKYRDADDKIVDGQDPFIKRTILPGSTSRIAVLISGLAAVAIGVCSTSYFFYIYLKTNQAPDLDKLYNVLLAMGIGVIPYSVNKVMGAFTDKTTKPNP